MEGMEGGGRWIDGRFWEPSHEDTKGKTGRDETEGSKAAWWVESGPGFHFPFSIPVSFPIEFEQRAFSAPCGFPVCLQNHHVVMIPTVHNGTVTLQTVHTQITTRPRERQAAVIRK